MMDTSTACLQREILWIERTTLKSIFLVFAGSLFMGVGASLPKDAAKDFTLLFQNKQATAGPSQVAPLWKFTDPARFAPAKEFGWSLFGFSTGNTAPSLSSKHFAYSGGILFSESGANLGFRTMPTPLGLPNHGSGLDAWRFGAVAGRIRDYGYVGGPTNRAISQNFGIKQRKWAMNTTYTDVGRTFMANPAAAAGQVKGDGIDSAALMGLRGQQQLKSNLQYNFSKALSYSVEFLHGTTRPVATPQPNAKTPPSSPTLGKSYWHHALKYTLSPGTAFDLTYNTDRDTASGAQKRPGNLKNYYKFGVSHAFSKTLKVAAFRDFTGTHAGKQATGLSNTSVKMDWAASRAFGLTAEFTGKSPSGGKWERTSNLNLTSSFIPGTKLTAGLKLGSTAAAGATLTSTYGLEAAVGPKVRPFTLHSGLTLTDPIRGSSKAALPKRGSTPTSGSSITSTYGMDAAIGPKGRPFTLHSGLTLTNPARGASQTAQEFSVKHDLFASALKTSVLAEFKSNATGGVKPVTTTTQHVQFASKGLKWLAASADVAMTSASARPDMTVSKLDLSSPIAAGFTLSTSLQDSSSSDGKSQSDQKLQLERKWKSSRVAVGYRDIAPLKGPDVQSPFFESAYNTKKPLPEWAKPLGTGADQGPTGDATQFGYRQLPAWVAGIQPGLSFNFQPKDPKSGRTGTGWSFLQPFGDQMYVRAASVDFGKDDRGNLLPLKESVYEVGHAVSQRFALIARYSEGSDAQKRDTVETQFLALRGKLPSALNFLASVSTDDYRRAGKSQLVYGLEAARQPNSRSNFYLKSVYKQKVKTLTGPSGLRVDFGWALDW